jgi:Notch-like protein
MHLFNFFFDQIKHLETGYFGRHCGSESDLCAEPSAQGACQNGGVCVTAPPSFTCDCPEGFTGEFCEENVDECDSGTGEPMCANAGKCVDGINSFTCECALGYEGNLCSTGINECPLCPAITAAPASTR